MAANPYILYPFAEAGDTTPIMNTGTDSGTMSYQAGFTPNYELDLATDASALPIPRKQMNQLFLDITTAIQQQQTQGFALWVAPAVGPAQGGPANYPILATVAYDAGSGIQIWQSAVASNTSVPGADANWTNISGGAGLTINTQVITTTATYTPTAGMAFIQVRMVGGGGGGAAGIGSAGTGIGGSGGAGAYGEGYFTAAQIGASKLATIGAAGTAGNGGAGGNGGTTSLGSLMTAPGGIGGVTLVNTTSPLAFRSGAVGGAAGTGGYINLAGNSGNYGVCSNSAGIGIAGDGADSPLGAGGNNSGTTGNPGLGYGSGGNGGFTSVTSVLGGAGAPGVIIITEYCY